jgi:hypothetical protein
MHHNQNNVNAKREITSYQGKSNIPVQSKNSNGNQLHRHEEARYTPEGHYQEGRTDAHPSDDMRNSSDNLQYSFASRDGPSPGRNYNYGIQQDEIQAREHNESTNNKALAFRPPRGKRKLHTDQSTPGGPRLISNQSSDDSINALFPSKRARVGSLFPDSATFMNSFNLSPMNSRTFSREEPIDMPRFAAARGSAEGSRIFQSWSSGNSRSENHSPSDVRNCYDDWHSTATRRANTANGYGRSMGNINEVMPHGQGAYDQRNHSSSQRHWQGAAHGHEQLQPHAPLSNNSFDMHKLDRGYHPSSGSTQLQALHPEDRYNEQLLQGYSQGVDVNRSSYWNHQGQNMSHPYSSQRRDDVEDGSANYLGRGNFPPPHHQGRLSAPMPPATNSWGRYGSGDYHHGTYDSHGSGPYPHNQPYDAWGQPLMRGGRYDGHYNPKEHAASPYPDRLPHLKSLKIESDANGTTGMVTTAGILLLSLPEDRVSLSETLCIVRENVEVFTATEADVKAPAPGRKRPVVEGQVGLRCIHCRAAVHQSEKVKRAVCFPSSIKRIYRTVIDMKLDHFKACRFVPVELKIKLEELRATNARSTGTTMQYFVQAATRMGMVDGSHGISLKNPKRQEEMRTESTHSNSTNTQEVVQPPNTSSIMRTNSKTFAMQQNTVPTVMPFTLSLDLSTDGESNGDSGNVKNRNDSNVEAVTKDDITKYSGKVVLALPEDKSALSPLRRFLRQNVCAFSATHEDIAVRTPTTFAVVLGQVGIGCIHCLSLPARERSNRAVCFPFSINRIYQSVADIQRFHFSECKKVPPPIRAKFLELQSASSKGSKGLATRQYWVSSAKKIGLADSDCGIQFARDPSIPLEKAKSLDILAQVASDVTTASQPLVLPEDKPKIARFLYVVMKQLQPCRFTEADRNKRRLKDVGCIGVECKNCAGQVDGRKFFWSSVNAVESNFVSVHSHMMECKMIGQELKDELAHLKSLRKEQTARLKSGSQKAFFAKVWKRLHNGDDKIPTGGSPSQNRKTEMPPQEIKTTRLEPGMSPFAYNQFVNSSTPPISDFKPLSGTKSPHSSTSSQTSRTCRTGEGVKFDASPLASPLLTSKPEYYVKDESKLNSINTPVMPSPMPAYEAMVQGGNRASNDFSDCVIEEI